MASVASEAVETEEGGSGECDEGEYVPSVPREIVHEYKYTGRDGTAERTLEFGGVDMKGLVDLTTFGKVTGEALWPCRLGERGALRGLAQGLHLPNKVRPPSGADRPHREAARE